MTFSIDACFGNSYAEAHQEFVGAAEEVGMVLESVTHPHSPHADVRLAVDVARSGPAEADRLLVLTSGVHGVELMAGSGCQVGLLRGGYCANLPEDTALVMIHGVNPLGAWRMTRTAEDLVDLCRNFPDFDTLEAPAEEYEGVHDALMAGEDYARLQQEINRLGRRRFVEVLMGGQYLHENGFGFGGREPIWSHRTLIRLLGDQVRKASEVTVVDLHSGAGPFGAGTIVCMHTGAALNRARELFGAGLVAPRDTEAGQFRDARGHCADGYERALPGRKLTSIVLELGTYPLDEGLQAVIESHWAEVRGEYGTPGRAAVDAAMLRHHLPDDPRWRESVFKSCVEVFSKALS